LKQHQGWGMSLKGSVRILGVQLRGHSKCWRYDDP
jgi:hypothetical protein